MSFSIHFVTKPGIQMDNLLQLPKCQTEKESEKKNYIYICRENVIRNFPNQDALNLIYRHYTFRIKYYNNLLYYLYEEIKTKHLYRIRIICNVSLPFCFRAAFILIPRYGCQINDTRATCENSNKKNLAFSYKHIYALYTSTIWFLFCHQIPSVI